MPIREIAQNFHNFFPKYILPLLEFSHCFCPKLSIAFARISGKAMVNSGKSNGKIRAKAMRKLGKRRHIFRAKIIAFCRISHCFCPNFLLLFPAFPIAFARIFHCFLVPEFFVFKFLGGGGAQWPPASYAYDYY